MAKTPDQIDERIILSDSERQALTIRPATPNDWEAYRDFYKGLKQPHMFNGFLFDQNLDARETYTNLFDNIIGNGSHVMWGMWHGNKMIGQSLIYFNEENGQKIATLQGSEIADAYRKQGLVDKFYETRMQYLGDMGFDRSRISTTIHPHNVDSQRAARRNGFTLADRQDNPTGALIFVPVDAVPDQAGPPPAMVVQSLIPPAGPRTGLSTLRQATSSTNIEVTDTGETAKGKKGATPSPASTTALES